MDSGRDHNKERIALEWIKKLANGINPIDGSILPDNDIVNNVHISRCLFYVADLLSKEGLSKSSSAKQYETEFNLTLEDVSKVFIAEESSISLFVKEINKVIPENMKPLSAFSVTKWLAKIGYLDEVLTANGRKTKIPTDKGKSIGISSEQRVGSKGEYTAVIYDEKAQRFILENLFKE